MLENNVSTVALEAYEWSQYFAIALDEWCQNNGVIPKSILKDQLGIPESIWSHLSAGKVVTDKKWYALIYHHTGIQESDPRTLPQRSYKLPNGRVIFKDRAMNEDEWQDWLKNFEAGEPENPRVDVQDSTSLSILPQSQQAIAIKNVENSESQREYRRILHQRFDSLLEHVLSETVPRYPDPHDDRSIDQLLLALKSVFEKLAERNLSERNHFAHEHGRALSILFPYIEAYTLPEDKKREQALSMILQFSVNSDISK
jgi:hypothetical protein